MAPCYTIIKDSLGRANISKIYRALHHVPRNNVLKFQKDGTSFTQDFVNKLKLNEDNNYDDTDKMIPIYN